MSFSEICDLNMNKNKKQHFQSCYYVQKANVDTLLESSVLNV